MSDFNKPTHSSEGIKRISEGTSSQNSITEEQNQVKDRIDAIIQIPQTSISQDENNILDNSTPKVEQNGNSKFLVNSKWERITSSYFSFENFDFSYFEKYGIIVWEESDRGRMLIDEDGTVLFISEWYYGFNFKYFQQTWLILAREKWLKEVLLNSELQRMWKDLGTWEFFDEFSFENFEETWIILGKKSMEGNVLLDSSWNQISEKWMYYSRNFNFDYLKNFWVIIAEEKWLWYLILDKAGKQISPKNEHYSKISFDEWKKQFFYKWTFWFKRKIWLDNSSLAV